MKRNKKQNILAARVSFWQLFRFKKFCQRQGWRPGYALGFILSDFFYRNLPLSWTADTAAEYKKKFEGEPAETRPLEIRPPEGGD